MSNDNLKKYDNLSAAVKEFGTKPTSSNNNDKPENTFAEKLQGVLNDQNNTYPDNKNDNTNSNGMSIGFDYGYDNDYGNNDYGNDNDNGNDDCNDDD